MKLTSKIQLAAIFFPSLFLLAVVILLECVPPKGCVGHKVSSRGHGSNVKQFAEMNAIKQWVIETKSLHEDLANWHAAEDRSVRCHRVMNGRHYYCRAFAKPCLNTHASNQNIDLNSFKPVFPLFRHKKGRQL